eukprot:74093_1
MMSTPAELYLATTNDVISNTHAIPIRYHLFQDDHKDEPLSIGTHCYIIFKDRRHPTYLVSALITNVDCVNEEYTVQRINDNEFETYPWHHIVIDYNKQIHSVNIGQHKQKILSLRNTPQQPVPSPSPSPKPNHKRKRKRDPQTETQPNKKRKLNNNHVQNTSNPTPDTSRANVITTVAQPYFPIPHPYYRQNALLKWKPKVASPDGGWDVGRIVDFNMDCATIYIQNTYRCGTKDDESEDVFEVSNWQSFVDEREAQFIDDMCLYRLYSSILYWWDRPGCGSVCEDTIEGLDYGARDDLIYGITGGKKKKKTNRKPMKLVWCNKDGIFAANVRNRITMSKYIAKNKAIKRKKINTMKTKLNLKPSKVLDCVVIGAGMAGCTARWALKACGHEYKVKVLEAQDYIGGRLKQYSFPSKTVCDTLNNEEFEMPSVSVELGAAFLSGSGKDNRFWNWLQRKERYVCTDWGGYNNGWWNGDSFIDAAMGEFVDNGVIERIKAICDDIQTLCCKLLMPLQDMAVVDALEYLKRRIPRAQLFDDATQSETYFYAIYDKYKILSANWVGPQGLWQQQQTVELRNLDFEALYVFLSKVFANKKRGKKWLRAVEQLIVDYYGDNTNIKTENMSCQIDAEHKEMDVVDSEATESEESNSVTLSPLPTPAQEAPVELPSHVNWDEIVRYDVSAFGERVPFQYKFGYKDVLVRDIIHPPLEEEAGELQRTSGLSELDYERFREALQHLGDCNLFSYHLYFLRSDEKWKNNSKVQELLLRFKEDLDTFDAIIADFKNILYGKNTKIEHETSNAYHMNRKRMPAQNKTHVEANGTANTMDDAPPPPPPPAAKEEEKVGEFKQTVFDEALALNPEAPQVGDGFIVGGYSQVLEAFVSEKDRKDIKLNHKVTSVERYKDGVSAVRGIDLVSGKPFCLYSRFVVCSVPLGVLKLTVHEDTTEEYNGGILFKPALSAAKQEAIRCMGMGVENKVYLRFTHCFWPRDKPYFQSIQHPEYRFINLSYDKFKLDANTNVLCSMIPPNVAKKWHKSNPAQELRIIWDVLRVLKEMFKERCAENNDDDACTQYARFISTMNHGTENDDQQNECKKEEHEDMKVDPTQDTQRVCTLSDKATEGVPALLRMLVDYKVTDWEHNLFTRGSYSYLPKGAIYTHCKSLQTYDGNGVYLCGEATSVARFECVDGAHETGFSVAKQIHKQLQKRTQNTKHK